MYIPFSDRVAISSVLGLLAGYVDVICLVRYGAFAVTQTGNIIFIGSSLHAFLFGECQRGIDGQAPDALLRQGCAAVAAQQVAFSVAVLVSNLAGAYTYCALHHRYPRSTASCAAPFFALLTLAADAAGSLPDLFGGLGVPGWEVHQPSGPGHRRWHDGELTRWSVCLVAYSLGAVHFLSNTADGSRLKAPAFAATGHLQKIVKFCWNHGTLCKPLSDAQREAIGQSVGCVLMMLLGAMIGGVAMHLNPFVDADDDGDTWLLVPAAIVQFAVLKWHDAKIPPPGGWPSALVEPLAAAPQKV